MAKELKALGFEVLPSSTNFLLAKHPQIGGERLYLELKSERILVRYFSVERIRDYIRVSIGSDKGNGYFLWRRSAKYCKEQIKVRRRSD